MSALTWVFRKRWHPERERLARVRTVLLIIRGWETEICGRCGRGVGLCWHAPDELWRRFSGYPTDSGVLCLRCFDTQVRAAGDVAYWECALQPSWPSCSGQPCPHEETMRICCDHRDEYWRKLVERVGEDRARELVA